MDNSKNPGKSSSHPSSGPQQDQVQAIYLAQANIFAYEARKSAKSWVPLCDSTVPISILYDNTRSIYRIISVDADIKEVVVNTTVIPELEFVKTTQKFGYWKDIASGRVFGIGFASEYEAEAFDECLRKVKQNIGGPIGNSSVSLSSSESGHQQSSVASMQGLYSALQEEMKMSTAAPKLPVVPPAATALASPRQGGQLATAGKKQVNWDDYDQLGPAVLSFMNNNRHQSGHTFLGNNVMGFTNGVDHRPSTYKVDLPIIGGGNSTTSTAATCTNPYSSHQPPPPPANLEEMRKLHHLAPPSLQPSASSPYHHVPYPHHQYYPSAPGSHTDTPPPSIPGPPPLMPLTMSIPHGYCYQGPPSHPASGMVGTSAGAGDSSRGLMDGTLKTVTATADLLEEINRLKSENIKLSESLIESTCNAKKWELQVSSLREDNIQLVKSVADLNSQKESFNKESREYKEQANRWKEHYQQAVSSAKEKSHSLKDAEDKLKCCTADKSRIESVMKDLEEELKRQQQINREQQTLNNNGHVVGQFSNKYFKELEDHYRKLLADSQKKIEEMLRKDGDRKNVLRGVDTLFTGAIQGLINIHGQIRQAYEQQ